MTQNEFKVMEWLRKVRDDHYEKIKYMSHDEILRETKERAEEMEKQIEEVRKKKQSQNQ